MHAQLSALVFIHRTQPTPQAAHPMAPAAAIAAAESPLTRLLYATFPRPCGGPGRKYQAWPSFHVRQAATSHPRSLPPGSPPSASRPARPSRTAQEHRLAARSQLRRSWLVAFVIPQIWGHVSQSNMENVPDTVVRGLHGSEGVSRLNVQQTDGGQLPVTTETAVVCRFGECWVREALVMRALRPQDWTRLLRNKRALAWQSICRPVNPFLLSTSACSRLPVTLVAVKAMPHIPFILFPLRNSSAWRYRASYDSPIVHDIKHAVIVRLDDSVRARKYGHTSKADIAANTQNCPQDRKMTPWLKTAEGREDKCWQDSDRTGHHGLACRAS